MDNLFSRGIAETLEISQKLAEAAIKRVEELFEEELNPEKGRKPDVGRAFENFLSDFQKITGRKPTSAQVSLFMEMFVTLVLEKLSDRGKEKMQEVVDAVNDAEGKTEIQPEESPVMQAEHPDHESEDKSSLPDYIIEDPHRYFEAYEDDGKVFFAAYPLGSKTNWNDENVQIEVENGKIKISYEEKNELSSARYTSTTSLPLESNWNTVKAKRSPNGYLKVTVEHVVPKHTSKYKVTID